MKKIFPVLLGLLAILLFAVGTAAGARLLSPSVQSSNENNLLLANQPDDFLAEQPAAISLAPIDDIAVESLQTGADDPLEAVLKIKGEAYYCDCETGETCEYVLLDDRKETLVEGDSVRTGPDGSATITFGNEVDLVLSANTQVRILKYQETDVGIVQIHIEQLVGEAYFNVKYSKKESPVYEFKILTPTAVTEQVEAEGKLKFSGVSTVQYEEFAGLTSEELADAIAAAFSTNCGALCFEDDCSSCQIFAGLSPIDLQVDDVTGELIVKYIDENGYFESTLNPGETFQFIFDGFEDDATWETLCAALRALLNGEPLSSEVVTEITEGTTGTFVSIIPTPTCGDGVCDIYNNEDKQTCPQDCK